MEEFKFIPPPEAPVFKPTWEEFQDALGYINKIRPIAEQSGICKIVPPPDWQPPFAVDVDNFKFTPRIQRLNELEAHTRIKLNFLDQIAKFWELQGSSLKIPLVEKRALDLFSLHKHVQAEGGAESVTKERKWSRIVNKMGYPSSKNLGTLLKSHYERILHPYDIFNRGKSVPTKKEGEESLDSADKDYKPHKIPSRMAGKIPESEKNGRRSRRYPDNQSDIKTESEDEDRNNKEVKRLQFLGPGPKNAPLEKEDKGKTRGKKIDFFDYDPLAKYICLNCGRGDAEDQMLLCDGCDDSYHTFCLVPMLPDIPKGDWRCPKCVAVEVSKPLEAFGFEQAQKEYTLQSFGEMADKFKQDYFNMPVHTVPLEVAQQEFWRIVSSIDEDVTVEYGADLHTMDHGSGFPTKDSKNILPADQEYATSSWNLNNMPVAEGSVLGHINCDISGMKVPWMYVGMCFSTFCWHNEDHWSYSINYLHWGEPKTWYGVPGGKAEEFESAMRGAAPELFDAQPDLLHQLVTIMNPNIIQKGGVPIVRTDQNAGEFVITFPRSYHAGFNQGYNFAEAVNFCPPDWLPIGRECVNHYSNLKRYCVFSHDELVCLMAGQPESLGLMIAAATYQDLLNMYEQEKALRKVILQEGIHQAKSIMFENMADDERQCDLCKTTCFLSAVSCDCTKNKIVCPKHFKSLCECASNKKTLLYRYTMDDLPPMLKGLKSRAESFDNWASKVKEALEVKSEDKLELSDLRELLEEAEEEKFPDSELLQSLLHSVTEAEKCATVAGHLAAKKVRTRTRGVEVRPKLSLEELKLFNEQIESLPCVIKEATHVQELLTQVESYQEEAKRMLSQDDPDLDKLAELVEVGYSFDIDLPQLLQLKVKQQQYSWLDDVEEALEDHETLTDDVIEKLIKAGENLPPSKKVNKATVELHEILNAMKDWEKEAEKVLSEQITIDVGEKLIAKADLISGHIQAVQGLKEAVKKAKEWTSKSEPIANGKEQPVLESLESLVNKGRSINILLPHLPKLENDLNFGHSILEKISKAFLKKGTHLSLIEVLVPRTDIGVVASKRKRFKKEESSASQQISSLLEISSDTVLTLDSISKAYVECQEREMGALRAIRAHNKSKQEDMSFCVCAKVQIGKMLTCSLCLEKFHWSCIPNTHRSKYRTSIIGRFLCVSCERSRRPRLDSLLSILLALQKVPVRLIEAEALQGLTERAVLWQNKARQFIKSNDLMNCIQEIQEFSKKLNEKHQNLYMALDPLYINNGDSSTEDDSKIDSLDEWSNGGWSRAAESLSSEPVVKLSDELKQSIHDILIEGEVLEVTMDELTQLGRIYQAAVVSPANLNEYFFLDKQPTKPKRKSEEDKLASKKPRLSMEGKKPATTLGKKLLSKGPKQRRSRKKKSPENETSDGEETEEKCAVALCLNPLGDNVEWVQCDGCDLWFHYACVGLRNDEVKEDEDYLCNTCTDKKKLEDDLQSGVCDMQT